MVCEIGRDAGGYVGREGGGFAGAGVVEEFGCEG